MGNQAGRIQKAEMREQYTRDVNDDRSKIEEAGEAQKRAIDEAHQAQLKKEKAASDAQVANEASIHLAGIRSKSAEIAALQDRQRESLSTYRNEKAKQTEEAKEMLEEKLWEENWKRMENERDEASRVSVLNEELDNQRTKVLQINDKHTSQRTAMQEKHTSETERKTKEHQEYVLKSNADINQIEVDGSNRLKQLVAEEREAKKKLTERKLALESVRTQNLEALVDKVSLTKKHDELRQNCKSIQTYFTNFRNAYQQQERSLTKLVLEMRRKAKLTTLPQPVVVYRTLDALDAELKDFIVPDEFEDMELEATLHQMRQGCAAINESFSEVEDHVHTYQDEYEKAEKSNEQLEEIFNATSEEVKTMKDQMKTLGELIKKFNIPMSNAVDEELNRQMKTLLCDQQKQILGGSSSQKQLTE